MLFWKIGKNLPFCKEKRFETIVSNQCFLYGGIGGNRTRVQTTFDYNVYMLSLLFRFRPTSRQQTNGLPD